MDLAGMQGLLLPTPTKAAPHKGRALRKCCLSTQVWEQQQPQGREQVGTTSRQPGASFSGPGWGRDPSKACRGCGKERWFNLGRGTPDKSARGGCAQSVGGREAQKGRPGLRQQRVRVQSLCPLSRRGPGTWGQAAARGSRTKAAKEF